MKPNQPLPPASPPQPKSSNLLGDIFEGLLWGAAVVGAVVLAGEVAAALAPTPRLPAPRRSKMPAVDWDQLYWEGQVFRVDQLAKNRRNGSLMERAGGRELLERHPGAELVAQVHLQKPDGTTCRADYVLRQPDGTVRTVEVKHAARVREQHVRQAEEQAAALKHTHGVDAGRPLIVVRPGTVVSEKHRARADFVTAKMRKPRA